MARGFARRAELGAAPPHRCSKGFSFAQGSLLKEKLRQRQNTSAALMQLLKGKLFTGKPWP